MRIYINGKYRLVQMTGVQRVATELVDAMTLALPSYPSVTLEVLEPPEWLARSRHRALLAFLWEQLVLPWRSRGGLLLSLCNTGPVLSGAQTLVLHDAAVFDMPGNYTPRYVAVQKLMMCLHRLFRRRLFTVSQFSRERLAHWLGMPKAEIGLLGIGSEHAFSATPQPDVLNRLNLVPNGYILAIGSRQPGKNLGLLAELARTVDLKLSIVIVGGSNSTIFNSSSFLEEGRLVDAGYVSDSELSALLDGSRCYVQPSLYEGFGLPVLEAMARGVPVLSSNAASLPEVGGDAVRYFDPHRVESLASVLQSFLADPSASTSMKEIGIQRAKKFCWRDAANRLLNDLITA